MQPVSLSRLLALVLLGACTSTGRPMPDGEFLVAAGDSTYWVQSGPNGLRVRGAPLTLARFDGRFHEVFVTDDDRSFEDAAFVAPRVYRRDLMTGDSTLVWQDSSFAAEVEAYAVRHPTDRRLEADEEPPEEPKTSNSSDFGMIELHGPFLSYEYHTDVDANDEPAWHATRRGVIDLRTGRTATVASLFGDTAAMRAQRLGRRAYLVMLDSILAADGEGARLAARSLGHFRFDPESFALTDVDGTPAVSFHAPGRGEGPAGGMTLPLPPLRMSAPAWWTRDVRAELPVTPAPGGRHRWRNGRLSVEARYDVEGDGAELLVLDERGREWRVGQVGSPVYRIHWIGGSALDSAGRKRLARAFDEAVLYDETVRVVSAPGRGVARRSTSRVPRT